MGTYLDILSKSKGGKICHVDKKQGLPKFPGRLTTFYIISISRKEVDDRTTFLPSSLAMDYARKGSSSSGSAAGLLLFKNFQHKNVTAPEFFTFVICIKRAICILKTKQSNHDYHACQLSTIK